MGQGRCCIYCRISMDRTGAGLGVERQEKECRELAARLGLQVVRVFSDNDRSAYSGKKRPAYEEMLKFVEEGHVSAILAWHTDRLHRLPKELERYIDKTQDVPTHTVIGGTLDLSTPSGRMVARQLGAVARYESEVKAERVRSAYAQRVASGQFGGGRRRFGWTASGQQVIPEEAAEIAKAADTILAGGSLAGVARDLNRRGFTTALGHPWNSQAVQAMLRRPLNAGIITHDGKEAGHLPGEPIIPPWKHRQLCDLLADPSRRSTMAANRAGSLGTGFYECGRCGKRMRIGNSGQGSKVRGYRCPAGHLTHAAATVDEFISTLLLRRLLQPGLLQAVQPYNGPALEPLYAERARLRRRQEEIGASYAKGGFTSIVAFNAAIGDIEKQAEEVERRIAVAGRYTPLVHLRQMQDHLVRTWPDVDLDTKRLVLSILMERVVILPARVKGRTGFDPARVQYTWRVAEGS